MPKPTPAKTAATEPRGPLALVRPLVRELHPYVPGEQPQVKGLIKLNTNENPYPPSPGVLAAVKAATDARLRLYPNPTADALRAKLAKLHRCAPENLIVGNGSDELLALAVRAFVEPIRHGALGMPPSLVRANYRAAVQYFVPSYSLYPVLADGHGAIANPVPLALDFGLPAVAELKRGRQWDFRAALSFITTPNAPTGLAFATAQLEAICKVQRGVVLLDEAYVDFASENALALALRHPNVLVARTFSKAYSLCFQRVGYCVGHPELIGAMHKLRDSYNVNGLGQIAAEAALDDRAYFQANWRRLIATRESVQRTLAELGFEVLPSETNFLLCRPPGPPAEEWQGRLRTHNLLVRWFDQLPVRDYLRITIGTEAEMAALVKAIKAILRAAV
jgi:histidinol-phosphate aminotransferase